MIATEVIPNLWIGGIKCALDLDFLNRTKITVIINCTTKYPFPKYRAIQIRVPVSDRGTDHDIDLMYDFLITIVPNIYQLLQKGHRILVHCYAGCHRSVCVVLGFLMKYGKLTLQQSIDTLQSKWPRVGLNFSRSLCRYALNDAL